jgi:KDO2-lipid IV(A) lauroyltransferase
MLGIFIYYIYPLRKSIALSNLDIAFPNYSQKKKMSILKACYRHYGMVLIDFFRLPKVKREKDKMIVDVSSPSIEFMISNPGGIILSAHIGNWEYFGPILSNHNIKTAGVALIQKNPRSDMFFNKMRISDNMKVIPFNCGSKVMIQQIRDGYYLGLISDQNAGARGTEALFFNKPVSVPKGAAAFHLKTNTPILLGFCILCEDLHYKLSFQELDLAGLPKNINDAIVEINQRFSKILEKTVREYPEQYFWFHRKWNREIYKK